MLAIYNQEREKAGESGKKRTPGAWDQASQKWRWRERAEAFDAHIRAEQEAEWRERTMLGGQVLAGIALPQRFTKRYRPGVVISLEVSLMGHWKASGRERPTNTIPDLTYLDAPSTAPPGFIHRRLLRAVWRLPEPYRSSAEGVWLEGRDVGEVADRLSVADVVVRRRLARARLVVQVALAESLASAEVTRDVPAPRDQ